MGALLLLKAFASGCSALTGVEAVANAVPQFRNPCVKRAQRTEVALGAILGIMLIGLAVLIGRFHLQPVAGVTVLAQLADASLGHGFGFFLVQFATVVLLSLAANTSFGGLPVLMRLLARDNNLSAHLRRPGRPPGAPARRAVPEHRVRGPADRVERQYEQPGAAVRHRRVRRLHHLPDRHGAALVPAQQRLARRRGRVLAAQAARPRRAQRVRRAAVSGTATVVETVSKFSEGAWGIVVALPLLVLFFEWINRSYTRIGERLELGRIPDPVVPQRSLVVVPVTSISRMTREALTAAVSLGDEVLAVSIIPTYPDAEDRQAIDALNRDWELWRPGVPLLQVSDPHRRLGRPLVDFINDLTVEHRYDRITVLIAEVEPERLWQRCLQNQRGALIDRALRRGSDAVICRLRLRM